jgi:outer membrane protein assembly factor BamB
VNRSRTFAGVALAGAAMLFSGPAAAQAVRPGVVSNGSGPGAHAARAGRVDAGWTDRAGGPDGVAVEDSFWPGGPPSLSGPAWAVDTDHLGRPIVFVGQSGAVAAGGVVLAVGLIAGGDHLIAVDAFTGRVRWATPVPDAELDSWSTPTIDLERRQALVASGAFLTAIDLTTGAVRWQTALGRLVVNASPCVAGDLDELFGAPDRAFVTDYSFAGGGAGRLLCVNLAPFDSVRNPHQPGAIVWTATLPGNTSGATPAYRGGWVYAATATGPGATAAGRIVKLDARAAGTPAPAWTFTNPRPLGFFGGVAVSGDSVYASSYSFAGGQLAANTVRVSAATGGLVWSVPTNRTSATPVPLPDGRVLVSAGLADDPLLPPSGCVPSVALLSAAGGSAPLWDSALATHTDTNGNGRIDPGEPHVQLGGWTLQPAVVRAGAGLFAVVGTLEEPVFSSFDPPERLGVLDLSRVPGQAGFVASDAELGGNPAAVVRGWVYTVGPGGLRAFAPGGRP